MSIGYGFDGRKILITHDGVLELPTTPLRVEVFVINKLKLLGLREEASAPSPSITWGKIRHDALSKQYGVADFQPRR